MKRYTRTRTTREAQRELALETETTPEIATDIREYRALRGSAEVPKFPRGLKPLPST